MKQLTLNKILKTVEKPVYNDRIICVCGLPHVFETCPRCGMNRNESMIVELGRPRYKLLAG